MGISGGVRYNRPCDDRGRSTMKKSRDIPLLDVNLLQLFVLLYDTRSVSRSAERLDMAQPTISIWLGRLRQRLNDPLFIRTPSGMQPTAAADELIPHAREALASLLRISHWDATFDPATAERCFCISMSDVANITLLPQILAHVRAAAPNVSLRAMSIDGQTAAGMAAGEVDLTIGLLPELGKGFYQQRLFAQDWVCLAAPDHPRIGEALTLADYERESHIDVIPGTGHRLLTTALESHGVQRHVELQLPGYLGLSVIVRTSDLLATLPQQMGEVLAEVGDLKVYPCPFPIARFIVKQHWHARAHHDAGNLWLRNACAELFAEAAVK